MLPVPWEVPTRGKGEPVKQHWNNLESSSTRTYDNMHMPAMAVSWEDPRITAGPERNTHREWPDSLTLTTSAAPLTPKGVRQRMSAIGTSSCGLANATRQCCHTRWKIIHGPEVYIVQFKYAIIYWGVHGPINSRYGGNRSTSENRTNQPNVLSC